MTKEGNGPGIRGEVDFRESVPAGPALRAAFSRYPGYAHRGQRVGIFVDVQNLFYSARNIYDSKINFEKLRDFIAARRPLVRCVAYLVQREGVDQESFLEALRRFGYETKVKILRERPDGSVKGDWDMGIAIDTMTLSDRLDVVVIVSGDGDFVPLVDMLKSRGCRVEVAAFERSTAGELRAAADLYVPIGEELLIKGTRRSISEYTGDPADSLEDIS